MVEKAQCDFDSLRVNRSGSRLVSLLSPQPIKALANLCPNKKILFAQCPPDSLRVQGKEKRKPERKHQRKQKNQISKNDLGQGQLGEDKKPGKILREQTLREKNII
jgi:hypothetical protein